MIRPTTAIGFPVGDVRPCQWGRAVKTLDDYPPCLAPAERRLTVKRPSDGKTRQFELCAVHVRKLLDEADKNGTEVV